jgi:hypothetical protein
MFQQATEKSSLFTLTDLPAEFGEIAQTYRQAGYVQLSGFFAQEQTSALLRDLKQITDAEGSAMVPGGISLTSCKKIFSDGTKMQYLLSQSPQATVLQKLVGSSFWVCWDETMSKTLSQENDLSGLRESDRQLWVCLSRSTSYSDKLWVIPGSHQRLNGQQNGSLVSPVALETQPGDLVIVSPQAVRFTSQRPKDPKRFLGFMLSGVTQ